MNEKKRAAMAKKMTATRAANGKSNTPGKKSTSKKK